MLIWLKYILKPIIFFILLLIYTTTKKHGRIQCEQRMANVYFGNRFWQWWSTRMNDEPFLQVFYMNLYRIKVHYYYCYCYQTGFYMWSSRLSIEWQRQHHWKATGFSLESLFHNRRNRVAMCAALFTVFKSHTLNVPSIHSGTQQNITFDDSLMHY